MRAGWSRVTSLSNLLLIPPFPFPCAQDSKLCRDLERLGNPSRQASHFIFSLLLSRLSLSLPLSFLFPLDLFLSPRRESPESKPSRRWWWWWSSKWWWGDRPSVVMVVAVWCCGGDQISSHSCLLVPDLFRSHPLYLLFQIQI
ncbi:hypothetical protein F2Q69_00019389 [Brassica cretica]|uniref:Uncharacterized protein n=1 Tax=Brassica cretica TaxID=69181 RepID=A0A8S9Q4F6_BRACR|nr:hypothetical protein F2Q69_00019389 [Brassica cretica]